MDPHHDKDHDPARDGKSMMEQVTGAFLFPWPRKPLGKPTGGKGPGKPSGARPAGKVRTGKTRGMKQRKTTLGSWM